MFMHQPAARQLRTSHAQSPPAEGPSRAKRGNRYWQPAAGLSGDIKGRTPVTGWLTRLVRFAIVLPFVISPAQSQSGVWLDPLRENAGPLIQTATADDFAWQRLAELTDTFGSCFSGSANLDSVIRVPLASKGLLQSHVPGLSLPPSRR